MIFDNPLPQKRFKTPASYDEWAEQACEKDRRSGMDRWKREDVDSRYDYRRIRDRLLNLKHARETKDDLELLFALNEGIHGNLGGIANPALYDQAEFGTKNLITDYFAELEHAIEHIAEVDDSVIPFDDRLDFFRRASHCYGRSALMLSGAGSLTPYHLGVIKALHDQDVLPTVISGSSGGAVVAALAGSRGPRALSKMLEAENLIKQFVDTTEDTKAEFWPRTVSADYLKEQIERLVPDLTFEEAYERSGIYINISVASAEEFHKSRLLNVITTPHVYLREAVRASCSVPGVFPPTMLAAKGYNGKRKAYLPEHRWIDGAVSDDLPARRLSRLYGVNHFIASQTNPIVLWAINDMGVRGGAAKAALDWGMQIARVNLRASQPFARKLTKRISGLGSLTHIFYSVALQEYTADVTIMPSRRMSDPRKWLAQLSRQETLALINDGETSTWSKIERIRNSTRVSKCLDKVLKKYEHEAEEEHYSPQHHKGRA